MNNIGNMMNKYMTGALWAMIIVVLAGCVPVGKQIDWKTAQACELRLVAYKVQKAGYYYLEEVSTGAVFSFRPQGTWQFPTIALGESVQSLCVYDMNIRRTQWYEKEKSIARQNLHRDKVSKSLPDFEYLLKRG
jgi:hypothetical protein